MAPGKASPHEKWRRIFHFPSIHRLAANDEDLSGSLLTLPYIDIYPCHCLMVYNMIYIIVILS